GADGGRGVRRQRLAVEQHRHDRGEPADADAVGLAGELADDGREVGRREPQVAPAGGADEELVGPDLVGDRAAGRGPDLEPDPRPVAGPPWFAGAAWLIAALTVTLAFLLASFVARNSDLWLHLAAGKRLFAGEYRPGTDPFSYAAADRAWVNHSLLYDAGAYLLYRANDSGALVVAVKALAVAAAFALL